MSTLYECLTAVMPGGVNSPVRACKGLLPEPFVVERGHGALITDLDGKEYIDFCGAWGSLIHGHAHPKIVQSAIERIQKGSSFGITTLSEARLGRKIQEHYPSCELIRFVSSGTEATMTAIRLARGYTKRSKVIKFIGNYHGHSDMLLVKAGSGVASLPEASSAGIPQSVVSDTLSLPYNDVQALEEAMSQEVAAVILEPVTGNMGVIVPSSSFIHQLVALCQKYHTVLIFDEVITGFRVGLGGAQELFGVKPDLTCFGKIIGGGFNAAAFGGRKEIMEMIAPLGPVYQAGTLSGNPVAMEAGYQAISLLEVDGFYEELKRKTDFLTAPFKKFPGCLQQMASMFTFFFGVNAVRNFQEADQTDRAIFTEFFRYLFERGIYMPPHPLEAAFVSSAHTEEQLAKTQETIIEFIEGIS